MGITKPAGDTFNFPLPRRERKNMIACGEG